MLTLDELRQIRQSIHECYPSADDWGIENYKEIRENRTKALELINKEINFLVHKNETK